MTDAWQEAYREAVQRNLSYVGTDLVLLGLARSEGVAGEVLRELGAMPEAVERAIDEAGTGPRAPEADGDPLQPRATPATEHARGRAHGIAIGLGEKERYVHLLLALAYDRSGVHAHILRTLGIDRSRIVESLASRGVTVPSEAPPRDPIPQSEALVVPDEQARVIVRALGTLTVEHRERYLDEQGYGRWGYGGVPGRPELARVSAEPGLGLRELALTALRDAGYPDPPDDAWEIVETE